MGTLALNARAADFTTPNAKSPARCTLTLTASAVTGDTVIEPNPSNNQITIDTRGYRLQRLAVTTPRPQFLNTPTVPAPLAWVWGVAVGVEGLTALMSGN